MIRNCYHVNKPFTSTGLSGLITLANASDDDDIWGMYLAIEAVLTIMHTREATLTLFKHILSKNTESVINAEKFCVTLKDPDNFIKLINFLKLVLFRGYSLNKEDDEILSTVISLLMKHQVSTLVEKQMIDSSLSVSSSTSSNSNFNSGNFFLVNQIISIALDHFVRASKKQFDNIIWYSNKRFGSLLTDKDTLNQPNIAWSSWIFEILLTKIENNCEINSNAHIPDNTLAAIEKQLCNIGLLHKLLNSVNTPNIPLKTIIFTIISRILSYIRINISHFKYEDTVKDIMEFLSPITIQLLQLLNLRFKKERSSRSVFSPYTQSVTSLLINYQRLKLICKTLNVADTTENELPVLETTLNKNDNDNQLLIDNSKVEIFVEEIRSNSVILSWCDTHVDNNHEKFGDANDPNSEIASENDETSLSTINDPKESKLGLSVNDKTLALQINVDKVNGSEEWTIVHIITEVEPGTETEFTVV